MQPQVTARVANKKHKENLQTEVDKLYPVVQFFDYVLEHSFYENYELYLANLDDVLMKALREEKEHSNVRFIQGQLSMLKQIIRLPAYMDDRYKSRMAELRKMEQ